MGSSASKKYWDWFDSKLKRDVHGFISIAIAVVLILFALLVSCKCPCAVAGTDTETVIEVRIHDTTIVTEADSASMQLLLRCDSANNVLVDAIDIANGERLQMALQLQQLANGSGLLKVDCQEDSLQQIIAWQDSIIRTTTTTTIVKVEKQKDFVYWCGWVLIGLVIAAAILGIVMLIIKFMK